MIKNYMEEVVDYLLPRVIEDCEDFCGCEICINDVKAITLNNLKPMYFVKSKGNTLSKSNELEMHFKSQVVKEIVKSIEKVKINPKDCTGFNDGEKD